MPYISCVLHVKSSLFRDNCDCITFQCLNVYWRFKADIMNGALIMRLIIRELTFFISGSKNVSKCLFFLVIFSNYLYKQLVNSLCKCLSFYVCDKDETKSDDIIAKLKCV